MMRVSDREEYKLSYCIKIVRYCSVLCFMNIIWAKKRLFHVVVIFSCHRYYFFMSNYNFKAITIFSFQFQVSFRFFIHFGHQL